LNTISETVHPFTSRKEENKDTLKCRLCSIFCMLIAVTGGELGSLLNNVAVGPLQLLLHQLHHGPHRGLHDTTALIPDRKRKSFVNKYLKKFNIFFSLSFKVRI
jgi:hypothetical protein